ncbi:MAG TPA: hypothetical protein VHX37_06405 [Acidobacteriaceae bacterium]|jgi:hypothetical protein|nr:hypothetical protein [Acidobacteriaceae bacterium]
MTASSYEPGGKNPGSGQGNPNGESCSAPIDRKAMAGGPHSLGAKSDCNGRPTTDDRVVEAIDEQAPLPTPPADGKNGRG